MKRTSYFIALLTLLFLGLALLGVYWSIQQTPVALLSGSTPTPLSTFKDLFLVVASGILTLCSAYLGAFIQSIFQQQQKRREEKREITKPYKDYLLWVMQLGQLAKLVNDKPEVRGILPQQGKKYEITPATLDKVIREMPLWWGYSVFPEGNAKEKVSAAMYASIKELMDIFSDSATSDNCVEQKYREALLALDEFERM